MVTIRASRPTGLTGAAGEYFVAAELSLRGWLATVTIKNAPTTDVLAQHLESGRVVTIQTKTASQGNQFQLNQKCEAVARTDSEWFVLVKLNAECARPTFFIVPTNIVAGATFAQHREWLARSRPPGKVVKDTERRTLIAEHLAGYEDRWDLLEHSANDAPILLDGWYTECVEQFGLPSGHPGWPA